MTIKLNEIAPNKGAIKTSKRKGRGIGSGKGKTAGRGIKGQKSRSGVAIKGFEGGQMPLYRRLPKRGFNNPNGKEVANINFTQLETWFANKTLDAKKSVTTELLKEKRLIAKWVDGVKLLGNGEIKTPASIKVEHASKSAQEKMKKAGAKLELTGFDVKAPVAKAEEKEAPKKPAAAKPATKKPAAKKPPSKK